MDRAAAELFLAASFTETTPERQEVLCNAASAARNWEGLLPALEAHGLLALFLGNLDAAKVEIPAAVAASFEARAGHQRGEDQRARLGLQRFLAAAARERVEVTLVGGSALAFDGYPSRSLSRLRLHVAREHCARGLRAGEQAGFLLAEDALPAWWYVRTHTALPLAPAAAVLRPLAIATRLHHPSLLLTAREPEVLARRRRVTHEGHPLHLLDPIDGLLEVAVALAASAGEALLVSGRRHVLEAASRSAHPLRLDLLVDLRAHVERNHARMSAADVLARAAEWSAEPALRSALECLQMALGFLPEAREWSRQVARGLAAAAPPLPGARTPAQFRPDPIERLPQWLRPSEAFLVRSRAVAAGSGPRALRIARLRHVAGVLGACTLAGVGFPVALVGRRLARNARRRTWALAETPRALGELNDAWKAAAARAEQQKPIAPRTIAIEESIARYPDRYLG